MDLAITCATASVGYMSHCNAEGLKWGKCSWFPSSKKENNNNNNQSRRRSSRSRRIEVVEVVCGGNYQCRAVVV